MRGSGEIFWESVPHKPEDVGAFWAASFLGGQFTPPGFGSLLLREGVDFLQLSVQTAQLKWTSSSQGCPGTSGSLPKGGPPQWSFRGARGLPLARTLPGGSYSAWRLRGFMGCISVTAMQRPTLPLPCFSPPAESPHLLLPGLAEVRFLGPGGVAL